jgi:DNA-directed RNA polymerase specialized sigma24 family protein
MVRSYRDIRQDYEWTPDIFSDEPERVALLKEIIATRLNEVDRTIILLYADCQSTRKLGKRMGMSMMTVWRELQRIKKEITTIYEDLAARRGITDK